MSDITRHEARHPKDAGEVRAEALKLANKHRRRAERALRIDWDLKVCNFFEREAERVAERHGLKLLTFTLAGIPVATQYQ